jgi:hypothetical protein
MDTLTPLDARNSLLLDRTSMPEKSMFTVSADLNEKGHNHRESAERYYPIGGDLRAPVAPSGCLIYRPLTPTLANDAQGLLDGAAPIGSTDQQPTALAVEQEYRGTYGPSSNFGHGYGNGAPYRPPHRGEF